ncbi:MAG TPA: RdgB/HAM1 family non-canonical purine NTP pyrophosphatase [Planctomycetaceae bacterium]|jgi:XTP/dITP diphosphohydrolase|nr:RdgB/HAM1 family non-canonical purine NTP pyrophosphatase [Planctomycetaceae bacterium]
MSAAAPLVVASRNPKKSGEIRDLLVPFGLDVVSVSQFANVPDVVEDGHTFAENAAKKASETARRLSLWTLGEDSGLEVDALAGAPGIYSARFSGPGATDESNNVKLMHELSAVPDDRRGARYVCNVALADPSGKIRLQVEAYCRGRMTREPRGTNGFGYDPYFLIREYHRTFGELGPAVKRRLSHRARAFERLIPPLVVLLRGESASSTGEPPA